MAQMHEGYGIHGAPPPYTEDTKMTGYARHLDTSELDTPTGPASTHSSVPQGSDKSPSPPPTAMYHPQPQQPIGDAVHTAFDKAHIDGIDPNLIAQITQNVIQQLSKANVQEAKTSFQPPPPQQAPHSPPSTHSGASPPPMARNVYTPPSPHKHGVYPTNFGSPTSTTSVPASVSADGPTSPLKQNFTERQSPKESSMPAGSPPIRPPPVSRLSTAEETTLERIWGRLFEKDGPPTARLGQFLRGVAVHMIEDYEPKCSLVVTPEKLLKFYENMRVSHETYPWSIVFDDTQSSISRMYRQLECQHHLVQEAEHLYEKPDIPGLTPAGFEKWATMLIQAHPDDEYERFQKAALALPVNNPDVKSERFPKEIPRRLFPSTPDHKIRSKLTQVVEKHCRVTVEKPPTDETARQPPSQREPSPPRSEASFTSDPPYPPSNIERERNPYSSQPSESVIDDLSTPMQQPIERERKPYSATPSGGRDFQEDRRAMPIPKVAPPQEARSPLPPPPSGPPPSGPPPSNLHRASSSAANARPINIPGAPPPQPRQNDYIPESYHGMPHRPSTNNRYRAPSEPDEYGRRSEPDVRNNGFMPVNYSNSPAVTDDYEDDRRYARRPSPGRRYERSDTIDPRDNRRSMYDTGEEYYRARSNTTGGRNW